MDEYDKIVHLFALMAFLGLKNDFCHAQQVKHNEWNVYVNKHSVWEYQGRFNDFYRTKEG